MLIVRAGAASSSPAEDAIRNQGSAEVTAEKVQQRVGYSVGVIRRTGIFSPRYVSILTGNNNDYRCDFALRGSRNAHWIRVTEHYHSSFSSSGVISIPRGIEPSAHL